MELEYNLIEYTDFRHKEAILSSKTIRSPPPSLIECTKGSNVCSHFSGKGVHVPLRRLSRELRFTEKAREMRVFYFNNGYQLPRSRGYIFHKMGGGGGFR